MPRAAANINRQLPHNFGNFAGRGSRGIAEIFIRRADGSLTTSAIPLLLRGGFPEDYKPRRAPRTAWQKSPLEDSYKLAGRGVMGWRQAVAQGSALPRSL